MEQNLPLENQKLNKREIETVQINLGNRCNQTCYHCHMEGSPSGKRNMDRSTAQKILKALIRLNIPNIEFTGGSPEINPNLKFFIEGLSKYGKKLTVRTNLTILELQDYSIYPDLYKKHRVRVVASLPSIFEEATDRQRGKGVFHSSIRILKKLNEMGYGTNGLLVDLAYNPVGDHLPPNQTQLENEYKEFLKRQYGICFNSLITLVNCPITRFKDFLIRQGRYHHYMKLLKGNYNAKTLNRLMCRSLISVGDRGDVFDCDFNLAMGMKIKGYEGTKFWKIDFDRFQPEISLGEHCYACTVNQGSSCHGVLLKDNQICGDKETAKQS
jgi:radical SAM/Cys-rich protein